MHTAAQTPYFHKVFISNAVVFDFASLGTLAGRGGKWKANIIIITTSVSASWKGEQVIVLFIAYQGKP